MRRRGLIVAIDGPAASGKSTTARMVAEHFHYLYIDTGAMYRALTLKVLRKGIDLDDAEALSQLAQDIEIELRNTPEGLKVFLEGEEVGEGIRSPEVTHWVSAVSEVPGVREVMVQRQRELAQNGGVVLEGRDIGTVVFPEAEVKIFMGASVAERAARRYRELREKGVEVSLGQLEQEIRQRDHWDSTRKCGPLRKAEDALILDTTGLSIDEQVRMVISRVEEVLKRQGDETPL